MTKMAGDFWDKPEDVGGLGTTAQLTKPDGTTVTYEAAPVRDDFASVGPEPEVVRPIADSPCGRCGTVHAREGEPLCYCFKCGKFSRIVWCGQCVECTHARFSEMPSIGPEVADFIFRDYVAWKNEQNKDRAQVNKMPWEKV